jgi:hypothetical protein
MTGIKHYELRHDTDYIAKLRENTDTQEWRKK